MTFHFESLNFPERRFTTIKVEDTDEYGDAKEMALSALNDICERDRIAPPAQWSIKLIS